MVGEADIRWEIELGMLKLRESLNKRSKYRFRWSWCFKPRDEMGKDLAMCLQQLPRLFVASAPGGEELMSKVYLPARFDNDREEFEAKVVQ